jgi:hypothetical protein
LLAYAYIRFVYNVETFSTVRDILDKNPVLEFVGGRSTLARLTAYTRGKNESVSQSFVFWPSIHFFPADKPGSGTFSAAQKQYDLIGDS